MEWNRPGALDFHARIRSHKDMEQKNPERVYVVRWRSRSGPKMKTYLDPKAAGAFVDRLAEWDTRDAVIWTAECGRWALLAEEDGAP